MQQLTRGQQRKEYMKQYRENHKQHMRELDRVNYEKNKETIKEKRGVKCNCEVCGGNCTLRHKTTYEKTQKHQAVANNQSNNNQIS